MTTNDRFEQTLAGALIELGRVDATDLITDVVAATARVRQRRAWPGRDWRLPLGRRALRLDARWLVIALLIAMITAMVAIGVGGRVAPPAIPVKPSDPPSTAGPIEALPVPLMGTWVAYQPLELSFGLPAYPARMTLQLEASSDFLSDGRKIGWMSSDVTERGGSVRFATRVGESDPALGRNLPTDGVTISTGTSSEGVSTFPGCVDGDVGAYEWSVTGDAGATLALVAQADPCPARRVIFEHRIWQRSTVTRPSGPMAVQAFEPAFTITLPPKDYGITSTNASWEAVSADGNVRISAWQDPRLMRDACDARGGRIENGPGTEAFLAALESRPELSFEVQPGRSIGGHIAEVVQVSTRAHDACPGATISGWQGAVERTGRVWSLFPGWSDDLIFVDLDPHTLMLEVDVASPPEISADEILDSIVLQP